METKRCVRHGEEVPIDQFWKNKKSADGLYHYCKSCYSEINKKWESENKEERRKKKKQWVDNNFTVLKNNNLRRIYGITYNQYAEMLEAQDYRCPGPCGKDPEQLGKGTMVVKVIEDQFVGIACRSCYIHNIRGKIEIDWVGTPIRVNK